LCDPGLPDSFVTLARIVGVERGPPGNRYCLAGHNAKAFTFHECINSFVMFLLFIS
jgi:hypothetical protein